MSENMVERVEEAIFRALASDRLQHVERHGEETVIDGRFDLSAIARAAIEAMREPTPDMVHFGHGHWKDGKGSIAIYQAMIDAALKP